MIASNPYPTASRFLPSDSGVTWNRERSPGRTCGASSPPWWTDTARPRAQEKTPAGRSLRGFFMSGGACLGQACGKGREPASRLQAEARLLDSFERISARILQRGGRARARTDIACRFRSPFASKRVQTTELASAEPRATALSGRPVRTRVCALPRCVGSGRTWRARRLRSEARDRAHWRVSRWRRPRLPPGRAIRRSHG